MTQGHHPRRRGQDEGDQRGDEQEPEPAVGPLACDPLPIRQLVAGGQEVALAARQGQRLGHLVRGHQAGAAVEGGFVVGVGLPVVGGHGQGPPDPDGVAVAVDPARQAGPLPQEGLMGDLDGGFAGDGVVVGDDQPVRAVLLDHPGGDVGQLLDGGPAAEVVAVVARGHQLGEEAVHVIALLDRGGLVEVFGPAGQRPADATQVLIGLGGHRRVLAALEELGEGELQQGQGPGPADHIADHGGHQARLETDPDPLGGHHDGVLELGGGHRGDGERAGAHHRAESGVVQRKVVLIGAQSGHHPQEVLRPGGMGQQIGEAVPGGDVGHQGPQLLELVHDQHQLHPRRHQVPGRRHQAARRAQAGPDGGLVLDRGHPTQRGLELDQRVRAGHHRHHQRPAAAELRDHAGVHQ